MAPVRIHNIVSKKQEGDQIDQGLYETKIRVRKSEGHSQPDLGHFDGGGGGDDAVAEDLGDEGKQAILLRELPRSQRPDHAPKVDSQDLQLHRLPFVVSSLSLSTSLPLSDAPLRLCVRRSFALATTIRATRFAPGPVIRASIFCGTKRADRFCTNHTARRAHNTR